MSPPLTPHKPVIRAFSHDFITALCGEVRREFFTWWEGTSGEVIPFREHPDDDLPRPKSWVPPHFWVHQARSAVL